MEFTLWNISVLILYATCAINLVDGVCEWPTSLKSSIWVDNVQGDVTFSNTSLSGWVVQVSSTQSVDTWSCVTSGTFDSDGRLVMISTQTVQLFSVDYFVYACLTFTQITDYSYRYYFNNPKLENANDQRVFVFYQDTLTDEHLTTICSDSNGATGAEYHMMLKSGNEANAKVDCPWSFLGQYGYTHTAASTSSTTCDSSTSELDTCTNTKEISFNYNMCSTKVAYSVSDTVWCVDNVDVSGTNYIMMFNGNDADTDIDDSTVFRFTCMAVASDGGSASVSPQYCQTAQTPGSFPVNDAGASIGARLTFASPTMTCPTCPSLSNPDRGVVSIATNGAVTLGTYTCNSGYTMHGFATRTCQSSGAWSSTEPTCSCATPSTPANGAVSINSIGTIATYTCDSGFSIDGTATRTCQLATGTWDNTDPSCTQCVTIPSATGRIPATTTSGTVTSTAFTCISGYIRIGVASVTCQPNGQWDDTIPTCTACTILTNPASGFVNVNTADGVTSTATYSCSTGYTLSHTTARTCQSDGSWDGTAPTCSCNAPSTPSNGAVVSNGVTATYTCNLNYTLSGTSSRTCQSDGSGWTGSDSTCSPCVQLEAVAGGAVAFSTTGTVTSAAFTCISGSSLNGTSPIMCQADGTWNNNIPNCVECPNLSDPASGTVSVSTSGTTSRATYACASGYDINGVTILLCSNTGSWSQASPTCTCQSPASPSGGSVTDNGVTANYMCNSGFSLNGVSSRTCGTDGSGWSGSDPSCSTCATLITPSGGSVTSQTDGANTVATFTCIQGYTLNGASNTLTCGSNGVWDFSQPTCSQCPNLTDPSSGSVGVSTNGTLTKATYSCSTNYYISGEITLTCQSNGIWDNNPPTCKCNFPMTPSNGGVSVTDSSDGTMANYTCNTGYSLNGLVSRMCQTDGSGWQGSDPSCSFCQTVTPPTGGSFGLGTNGTFTYVRYTCEKGSTLNGARTLTCLSDGTYDDTAPTCATCPTLSNPLSGSVTLSTDDYTTTATYACVSGYSLTSGGTLTCTTSGTWDISPPACNCQSPPAVSNGDWVLATNQSTVTYSCDSGYVLTGSQTRHCGTDGSGWSGTEPSCTAAALNTGASTEDNTGTSIPLVVVIVMSILLIVLLVVVVVVTYLYITLRKRNKRVSSAEPDRRPIQPEPVVEETNEFSALPKSSTSSSPLSLPVTPLPPKDVVLDKNTSRLGRKKSRPDSTATTTDVLLSNGLTPVPGYNNKKVPFNSRRLTPIDKKPPKHSSPRHKNTNLTPRNKSKRKVETKQQTRFKENTVSPERVGSPLKIGTRTPDLLSTVDFNYIEPIYCYETEVLPGIGSNADTRAVSLNNAPVKH